MKKTMKFCILFLLILNVAIICKCDWGATVYQNTYLNKYVGGDSSTYFGNDYECVDLDDKWCSNKTPEIYFWIKDECNRAYNSASSIEIKDKSQTCLRLYKGFKCKGEYATTTRGEDWCNLNFIRCDVNVNDKVRSISSCLYEDIQEYSGDDKCDRISTIFDQTSSLVNLSLERRTLKPESIEWWFFILAYQFINRLLNQDSEPSFRQAISASLNTNRQGIIRWNKVDYLDVSPQTTGLRNYAAGVQHTLSRIARAVESGNFDAPTMCPQLARIYGQSLRVFNKRTKEYNENRLNLPDADRCRIDHKNLKDKWGNHKDYLNNLYERYCMDFNYN